MSVDENREMQIMLFDFYGDLLTEKQRECYSMYYNEDFSLSEIAEEKSISRQGAWDHIRHAEASLKEIEEKTGLIRRFQQTKRDLLSLREMLGSMQESPERSQIEEKVTSIIEAL